jgi:hypothetical protein
MKRIQFFAIELTICFLSSLLLATNSRADCNPNDVEPDCNQNGIQDGCDLLYGSSQDCNVNQVPDECDTVWQYTQRIMASDPEEQDYFGGSIAIDGDTLVVGAWNEGNTGQGSGNADGHGAAYVYARQNDGWVQQAKLTASDAEQGDFFGSSVSISGDVIAVGASGKRASGYRSGAAYVFERQGALWAEQAKVMAADIDDDALFGYATVLRGGTLVVGAPYDDEFTVSNGAVYIFHRVGPDWVQQTKFGGSRPRDFAHFGYSLSMDGDQLAVATANAEAAYLFEEQAGTWIEKERLTAPKPGERFGGPVYLHGDTFVVAAPGYYYDSVGVIYVFHRDNEQWTQEARIIPQPPLHGAYSYFGLSGSDGMIALGAGGLNGPTSYEFVSIYKHRGIFWFETERLTGPQPSERVYFGSEIAIAGSDMIVGVPGNSDLGENTGIVFTYFLDSIDADLNYIPDDCTGACCNNFTGECADALPVAVCAGDRQVWAPNVVCSQFDPPCVPAIGACCDGDLFGSCMAGVEQSECNCPLCVWLEGEACSSTNCPHPGIPATNEWGLVVIALLLMIVAKLRFGFVRKVA